MKQQRQTVTLHPDDNRLPDDAIRVNEAAKRLKCHIAKIHRWIQNGIIPGWQVKGQYRRIWYVSIADLDARVERYIPEHGPIRESKAAEKARNEWTQRVLKEHGVI